jgi:hypothetical protein
MDGVEKGHWSWIKGRGQGDPTPVLAEETLVPDLLLERVAEARVLCEPRSVEVYHRRTLSLRVVRRAGTDEAAWTIGCEEGTALRVREAGAVGFAAAAGAPEHVARPLLREALDHARPRVEDGSWSEGDTARSDHDDGGGELPPEPEVAEWLRAAIERAEDAAPGTRADEAWVEVALTCESLAGPEGLLTSRSRRRYWAFVAPRERTRRLCPPAMVAGRRWPPDTGALAVGLADRRCPAGDPVTAPRGDIPLLVAPEAAATLVLALCRALCIGTDGPAVAGGPGWSVVDEPEHPAALSGGSFDDAGFPTRPRRIAGVGATESLAGSGCWRRPSYRDEPRTLPSRLAVDAPPAEAAAWSGVLVTALRVHPLGRVWGLAIEGSLLDGGRPVRPIVPTVVRAEPADLVRRCLGGVGTTRESYRGVATPALWFADLPSR